jgi:gliding motility-associated-like protein
MKERILILFLFVSCLSFSQEITLTPVVIGSYGSYTEGSWGSISATVGEVVIVTASFGDYFLTQGFHQPNILSNLEIELATKNESCKGATDGYAVVKINGGFPPYEIVWEPNISNRDSVSGLSAGKYAVRVVDKYGKEAETFFTLESDLVGECLFKIYSGFTPNNDGNNDWWIIDGIENFPSNNVQIYNRWGDKVWEAVAYDNVSVVWDGNNKRGAPLPGGTYFYIVTVNGEIHKGWVELSR